MKNYQKWFHLPDGANKITLRVRSHLPKYCRIEHVRVMYPDCESFVFDKGLPELKEYLKHGVFEHSFFCRGTRDVVVWADTNIDGLITFLILVENIDGEKIAGRVF